MQQHVQGLVCRQGSEEHAPLQNDRAVPSSCLGDRIATGPASGLKGTASTSRVKGCEGVLRQGSEKHPTLSGVYRSLGLERLAAHLIHEVHGNSLALHNPFQGVQLGQAKPQLRLAEAGRAGHGHKLPLQTQSCQLPACCRHHVAIGLPHEQGLHIHPSGGVNQCLTH